MDLKASSSLICLSETVLPKTDKIEALDFGEIILENP